MTDEEITFREFRINSTDITINKHKILFDLDEMLIKQEINQPFPWQNFDSLDQTSLVVKKFESGGSLCSPESKQPSVQTNQDVQSSKDI